MAASPLSRDALAHSLDADHARRSSVARSDALESVETTDSLRDSRLFIDAEKNRTVTPSPLSPDFDHAALSSHLPASQSDIEKNAQALTRVKSVQYAPNDPGNPHNWPLSKRIFTTAVLCANSFIGTFSSSAITPGFADISRTLHVGVELPVLAFSIFVLGLAVGAPFASPASETFGRRKVYLIFLPIFGLFILGTGLSNNIAALIITRFFAGVFAAPAQAAGPASMADLWPAHSRTPAMAVFVVIPFLAPALAPMINGFVVEDKGWRWTSWVILFLTAGTLLPTLFVPETYKRTILAQRARLATTALPPSHEDPEAPTSNSSLGDFVRRNLARPLHMLVTEPVVGAFGVYVAFNFALVYAFFAAFPHVFAVHYGYGIATTGLLFLGVSIGALFDLPLVILSDRWHYAPRAKAALAAGKTRPPSEARLLLAKIGGPLLPAGLLIFGWSTAYRVHWIAPVVGEALFGAGNVLVFICANLYIVETYGARYGASAMAANTLLRYVLGAALPLFINQMVDGMHVQWAFTLLAALGVALAFVPWVLEAFGERLRARSAYAPSS